MREEKIELIEQLKKRIPEFERKKEEARQKLEKKLYTSEEEKKELQDWVYEGYPYDDVVSSMEEHLDEVKFEKECCPECGGKVVFLYFRSPQWTWDNYIGRSCYMAICIHCGKQVRLRMLAMN